MSPVQTGEEEVRIWVSITLLIWMENPKTGVFLHETDGKCNLKRIDCHVRRLKGFKLPLPLSIQQSGVEYGSI